jgi:predicted ATPase
MITQIKLTNFKCFLEETFEIAPLTLFCGINGMGKSSIIQSLLLLKQSFESSLLQTRKQVDLFNYSFTDLESAEDLCNIDAYPKQVGIALEQQFEKSYSWVIDASLPDQVRLPVSFDGPEGWENIPLFNESFLYLNAERYGPRRNYLRKTERVFNTKLGIQGELTPIYIFDAVTSNEEIGSSNVRHRSMKSIDFYENLNAWVGEILGREVATRVESINKDEVSLSFNIKGSHGGNFSALQVGFGYSFSLPIITAALIAKPGDLIIVENPEAHLHPSAQSKIGILLALAAQGGVQVMIETHSDHVLNGIRTLVKGLKNFGKINSQELKIHYFYEGKNEKGEQVHSRRTLTSDEEGKLSGWPAGFFDEWENNLNKLLF